MWVHQDRRVGPVAGIVMVAFRNSTLLPGLLDAFHFLLDRDRHLLAQEANSGATALGFRRTPYAPPSFLNSVDQGVGDAERAVNAHLRDVHRERACRLRGAAIRVEDASLILPRRREQVAGLGHQGVRATQVVTDSDTL